MNGALPPLPLCRTPCLLARILNCTLRKACNLPLARFLFSARDARYILTFHLYRRGCRGAFTPAEHPSFGHLAPRLFERNLKWHRYAKYVDHIALFSFFPVNQDLLSPLPFAVFAKGPSSVAAVEVLFLSRQSLSVAASLIETYPSHKHTAALCL